MHGEWRIHGQTLRYDLNEFVEEHEYRPRDFDNKTPAGGVDNLPMPQISH